VRSQRVFVLRRSNYRTLILGLTYGYCFGVELTVDNNIAPYFSDQFGKGIKAAGNFGAIFGLFNLLSRPLGAMLLLARCGPALQETARNIIPTMLHFLSPSAASWESTWCASKRVASFQGSGVGPGLL